VQVVSHCSKMVVIKNGRISSQLGEFPLPLDNLHGDPLCLMDRAPVEPPHANFDQRSVSGLEYHLE
jgi:hypothetical protein